MKRTIYAAAFCGSLLIFGAVTLTRPVEANKDVVDTLLELPAPPPPNPLMPASRGERTEEFYDKSKPPPDDAPIEDILDYWAHQSANYQELGYNITPSPRVLQRLRAEVSKDPEEITKYLNAFRGSDAGADFVKDLHDRMAASGGSDTVPLRTWLMWNSRHFAEDLERPANASGEADQYVANHDELLALGRNAWERAEPIVNRHYNDHGAPTSRVMATWALYRRAIDTDSIGDIERYRAELIAVVEDRNATPGMRDLALDALVKEKDWSGRDDWYFSLLADETLADLRVNGQRYTGLTTIIYFMPDGHYTEKMIEFAASDNRTVRNAAVRNLMLMNSRKAEERIIRALLPWLRDKDWATEGDAGDRSSLIRGLQTFKIPESVPGLIALLDERETRESAPLYRGPVNAANAAVGAAEAAARAANAAATAANTVATTNTNAVGTSRANSAGGRTEVYYPYRMSAVSALKTQADARAVPALRRILATTEGYGRGPLVEALLASGGFSIEEKVDAVQVMARVMSVMQQALERELGGPLGGFPLTVGIGEGLRERVNQAVASALGEEFSSREVSVEGLLGEAVMSDSKPSEELVRAMIDRIELLEKREPALAATMRSMAARWKGPAVNAMLLR
ncbi:MAG TPA: hypothetical protein VK918_02405, partial [Pyrinomonadaceae bacterium]|nr:hypothetical protein [Pyrinomonadaceae bacterium]